VTRFTLGVLAIVIMAGVLSVTVARAFGYSGHRASSVVSVVSQWLAGYAVWSLAGGLGLRFGVLTVYEPGLYALLALGAGLWHYRTRARAGRERARVIFVGTQLLWLAIVLAQNGVFGN
jgi:hypothetical protein